MIFTNITCCKSRRKLQIYSNTKLALKQILPIVCACEKPECAYFDKNLTMHVIGFVSFLFSASLGFIEN